MKRIALYARVSTSDQNPQAQVATLREFAAARQFEIVREYVDQVTGDVNRRRQLTQYDALMADAQRRPFDAVVVWKFDRFARSLKALLEALQLFESLGIDFISITQNLDTTTPMGRLFFQIVGAFAEFERSLIVERVHAGLANARKRGITLGRPRDPVRYDKIRALRARGLSLRGIQKETGIPLTTIQSVCAALVKERDT